MSPSYNPLRLNTPLAPKPPPSIPSIIVSTSPTSQLEPHISSSFHSGKHCVTNPHDSTLPDPPIQSTTIPPSEASPVTPLVVLHETKPLLRVPPFIRQPKLRLRDITLAGYIFSIPENVMDDELFYIRNSVFYAESKWLSVNGEGRRPEWLYSYLNGTGPGPTTAPDRMDVDSIAPTALPPALPPAHGSAEPVPISSSPRVPTFAPGNAPSTSTCTTALTSSSTISGTLGHIPSMEASNPGTVQAESAMVSGSQGLQRHPSISEVPDICGHVSSPNDPPTRYFIGIGDSRTRHFVELEYQ